MSTIYTSVRLKKATAKRVQKLGDLSDSWDSLLNALADYVEAHQDEWWDDDEDPDESEDLDPDEDEGVAA